MRASSAPTASGKTTCLNLVTGSGEPDRGRVLYRQTEITGLPPRAVADPGIARSFQIPPLYLSLMLLGNMLPALASS